MYQICLAYLNIEFCESDRAAYEKFAEKAPFKLPQGWAWTNLRAVCSIISKGTTPKGGCNAYCESGILFIRAENICSDGKLSVDNAKFIQQATHCKELSRSILKHGDLLVTIAGSLGRSAVVSDEVLPANTNQAVAFARPLDAQLSHFLQMAILSMPIQKMLLSQQKVTGIPNLTLESISNLPIPLPPLAEQKRIVSRIDELFKVADSLGETADGLETTAKHLDKKILDLAIRGKLVPQDPNDEPASELLKRIAPTSHKSPCKNQDKPVDPPFDIPKSWEWVRLREVGVFCGGHTPSMSNSNFWGGDVLWVSSKDMKSKYITDTQMKVSQLGAEELKILKPGTLLMCTRSGILRRTFPIAIAKRELTINQDQRALILHMPDMAEYIYVALKSLEPTILLNYKKAGTTVESIIWGKFIDLPIPLPPLAEQKRIVAKVNELTTLSQTLVAV